MAGEPATYKGVITEISSEDPKESGIRKKYVIIVSEGDNKHCIEFRGDYLLGVLQNFSIHDPVKVKAYARVSNKYNQYLVGHTIKINAEAFVTQ